MDKDPHHHPDSIELPTPTAWPIVAAFGLSLLFVGLVTNLFFSVIGLLTGVIGAVGWFGDVYPHPQHEPVDVRPESERAAPIRTAGRVVQMLRVGEGVLPNRAALPLEVHPYRVGVLGGIAGGIVMAVMACIFGQFAYGSIWYPINLLAAAGVPSLSESSLAALHNFSMAGLIVGTLAHGSISILIGLLYAVMIPMLPRKQEWIWGGIITPLLWTAVIYFTLSMISPMLAEGIYWPYFVICQVAFGLICGFVVYRSGKVATQQTWPMSVRLGVESQHRDEEKKS